MSQCDPAQQLGVAFPSQRLLHSIHQAVCRRLRKGRAAVMAFTQP